jgi:hypothetical protein
MDNFKVTYELFLEYSYKLLEQVEKKKDEYKAISAL